MHARSLMLVLMLMLMSMLMSHASVDLFVLSFVLPCAYAYIKLNLRFRYHLASEAIHFTECQFYRTYALSNRHHKDFQMFHPKEKSWLYFKCQQIAHRS